MTSLWSYAFGGSNKVVTPFKSAPVRALPASWYTSQAMYDFERRAIFSRRWMMFTHNSRLKETGDWLRYEVAGFDFIIARDRTGNINAFHNVCRHRAYPVIENQGCGNAKILVCRYHGWSYGLNGNLAKAPGYQELEFQKEENGLFRIHTKVDKNGFIWINLDAAEEPEVSWEEHFDHVDVQDRYLHLNFGDYELHHTYALDCKYNWKIASDNFNECYHCPTTHPDIPNFLNMDTFDSDLKDGHIQHHCVSTPEQKAQGLDVHSTYYFPNVSMSASPHFMFIQKFLPSGPGKTNIAYEIWKNKTSTDEEFHLIADMYERVMREDKVLCDNAQKNLERGIFVNGQMHPKWEKAPLFFQQTCREVVTEHYQKEKNAGKEIWPAKRRMKDNLGATDEDEELCAGLERGQQKEVLAW